jgi:hypothetical protein
MRSEAGRRPLSLDIPDTNFGKHLDQPDRESIYTERNSVDYDRSSIHTYATYGSGASTIPTSMSEDGDVTSLRLFSVLCMHDFDAGDQDQLSFRKNEILEVVKEEDSGWWAALSPKCSVVGWIPSAFVQQLTDAQSEKLRDVVEDLRIFEYEAERLYESAPTTTLNHLYADDTPREVSKGWDPSRGMDVSMPVSLSSIRAYLALYCSHSAWHLHPVSPDHTPAWVIVIPSRMNSRSCSRHITGEIASPSSHSHSSHVSSRNPFSLPCASSRCLLCLALRCRRRRHRLCDTRNSMAEIHNWVAVTLEPPQAALFAHPRNRDDA